MYSHLRPRIFLGFFGFAVLLAAGTARADFVVEQNASYGANETLKLKWHIGASEFRLETQRGNETKYFVYNGRVFYVCGKLAPEQLAVITKLGGDTKSLVDRLAMGACQELPTDFALRFFMSPFEAVAKVDTSGGFGTSLTVSEPQIALSGSVGSASDTKCVNFNRTYEISDTAAAKFKRSIEESACNAPDIKWRQVMSRNLGMSLVRSPGGRPNFQAITTDVKTMSGLSLTAEIATKGTDAAGKPINMKVQVATTAVKAQELPKDALGIPSGHEIIDTAAMARLAKIPASAPASAAAGSGETALDSMVKILLLGGSPAASAMEAVRGGEKKKK